MGAIFKKMLCLLSALMIVIPVLFPQEQQRVSQCKKADRYYHKAADQYSKGVFTKALQLVKKAISADKQCVQAYLLAGDIAMELNDDRAAINYYNTAISKQPDFFPMAHFILGNLYYNTGSYADALERYRYYSVFPITEDRQKILHERIQAAEVADSLKNNPVPYNPVNLCHHINTTNHEYANAVSADGQTFIFTVRTTLDKPKQQKRFSEEFFKSESENGSWSKRISMVIDGSQDNEGALTLSYDNTLIFFTSCHRPDGFGSCDLYFSRKNGEHWTVPENLGDVVNSSRWESQPSLSSDGKTLFFASNRPGGFGDSDIWKTIKRDGYWSEPENLGSAINTDEDEMSPYIHADGKTLYFSSEGHPGLGGADLFISRLQPGQSWSSPFNLGYPINTHADEINLIVHPNGMSAFISSDLQGGKGGYDIYFFELYEDIKPLPVSYVKGIILDAKTFEPLAAGIELSALESGQVIVQSSSDSISGEFIAVLPAGKNYALHVNHKNYLFYSHHFALDSVTGFFEPVILNIFLKPVECGQTVILKNVFFAIDSYRLEDISRVELNRLAKLLKDNPGLELELSGHTDNSGNGSYNKVLSSNRAKAVFEYLVGAGIDEKRLTYVGMGDSQPVDTNDTPEGRANNRRTEFRIVENKN